MLISNAYSFSKHFFFFFFFFFFLRRVFSHLTLGKKVNFLKLHPKCSFVKSFCIKNSFMNEKDRVSWFCCGNNKKLSKTQNISECRHFRVYCLLFTNLLLAQCNTPCRTCFWWSTGWSEESCCLSFAFSASVPGENERCSYFCHVPPVLAGPSQ